MKKKLLALAIAGAFVAPVAMADTGNVTVYGVADVSYDIVDNGDATSGAQGSRNNKVSSNSSRIGFKGAEDLGGGTSAIWQIESLVAMDGGAAVGPTNVLATRNTFAGLSGESWGTLVLGRNDSPYKTSTRRLDVFADSIADNRTLMGQGVAAFDGRTTDSVTYTSPKMGGVALALQYGAAQAEGAANNTDKGSLWSLSAAYDAAPFYGALAYEEHKTTVASGTTQPKEKSYKLGGGYKADQFEANLVWEKTSDNFGVAAADQFGHHAWTLDGKFNVTGSDAVKLAYTKAGDMNKAGAGANSSAKQISLGYDHAMSKRTTVYALYTKLDNDTTAAYALSSGVVATGFTAATGAGADPSAFSIGLKHAF